MTAADSIVVYSSPLCRYCAAAKRLLQDKGVAFTEIDTLSDPRQRAQMIERSGRHTVPQIFIGDRHIGGYDDLKSLDDDGELDSLLAAVRASTHS